MYVYDFTLNILQQVLVQNDRGIKRAAPFLQIAICGIQPCETALTEKKNPFAKKPKKVAAD